MCGRTSLYVDPGRVTTRFGATFDVAYAPRYNVAPRERLAVVPNDRDDTITTQEWGLLPPWADGVDDEPRPINARAETLAETSLFAPSLAERRCLVVVDGFYEWRGGRGHNQPYRFHFAGDEPFAFAGLWNRFDDGETLETVTIVTTEANDIVEPVHDRMPVILDEREESTWLHGSTDDALDLLDPYRGEGFDSYPVRTLVNDPANDSPAVLLEDESATTQRGLDEFE